MDYKTTGGKGEIPADAICALHEFTRLVESNEGSIYVCKRCQQKLIDTAMQARAEIRREEERGREREGKSAPDTMETIAGKDIRHLLKKAVLN